MPTSAIIAVFIWFNILFSLKSYQTLLHCCWHALTMFTVSVEILKDGTLKPTWKAVCRSQHCVPSCISWQEKPRNLFLRGIWVVAKVKGWLKECKKLEQVVQKEWVQSGNKGHGTLKVLPLDRKYSLKYSLWELCAAVSSFELCVPCLFSAAGYVKRNFPLLFPDHLWARMGGVQSKLKIEVWTWAEKRDLILLLRLSIGEYSSNSCTLEFFPNTLFINSFLSWSKLNTLVWCISRVCLKMLSVHQKAWKVRIWSVSVRSHVKKISEALIIQDLTFPNLVLILIPNKQKSLGFQVSCCCCSFLRASKMSMHGSVVSGGFFSLK